jgi:anti-anti-sigma factor
MRGPSTANAAEHAYPDNDGEFACRIARAGDGSIEVRVRDRGRWRPPARDTGYRGHGLPVLRELTEDLVIDPGPDGTEVRFRLAPPQQKPKPNRPSHRRPRTRTAAPASLESGRGADGQLLLAVHGDLDLAGRDIVGPTILAAAAEPPLVVDLTGAGYVSSAGVALLAEARAIAGPRLSVIVTTGSAPARLLQLAGLTDALAVAIVAPDVALPTTSH